MTVRRADFAWSDGPAPDTLCSSEVHVFRISLRRHPWQVRALMSALSAEEMQRFRRIRRKRDRDAYVISHGYLRSILGRYTGTPPELITFVYGPSGKPELDRGSRTVDIAFNLSHSGRIALIALAAKRQVGVDIEKLAALGSIEGVAGRALSQEEEGEILSLPARARVASFYACWTRKEAVVKARGASIASLSRDVIVTTAPNGPTRLIRAPEDGASSEWQLHDIPVDAGYAAALCYSGAKAKIYLWSPRS